MKKTIGIISFVVCCLAGLLGQEPFFKHYSLEEPFAKAKINLDQNRRARPNVKLNARMFDKIMWTLMGLASVAYFVGVALN